MNGIVSCKKIYLWTNQNSNVVWETNHQHKFSFNLFCSLMNYYHSGFTKSRYVLTREKYFASKGVKSLWLYYSDSRKLLASGVGQMQKEISTNHPYHFEILVIVTNNILNPMFLCLSRMYFSAFQLLLN